jgi:type I restriction enzyme S subunit
MVEEKYSKIPIGEIPEGWEVIRLKDVSFGFISGGTPSTKNPAYWNGDIPWMTSAHISGRTVTQGVKCITEEGLKNSATNVVPKSNILIATRVGIGKVAVNLVDMAISQDLTGAVLNHKKVNVDFVYWLLSNYTNKLKSLAQGSTIKGLLRKEIENLKLPLPPLPEQRRIAEILTTADIAIRKVDDAIAKTERLKRGLMQELLTKGIGHEEFEDSEVGRIPSGWAVVELSNVFKLASGKSRPPHISDTSMGGTLYPVYGGNGILGYANAYLIDKETIVIGRVGEYCGAVYMTLKFSWITDNALYVAEKLISDINLDFFMYLLTYTDLNKLKKKSGQPLITQKIIHSIKIPLPPLSEQRRIAEILITVDKKLELERKRKEKLERIKKGLMNDLLTGKKRVKIAR